MQSECLQEPFENDMKDLNRALEDHGASVVSEIGQGYYLKIEDQEKIFSISRMRWKNKKEKKDFKKYYSNQSQKTE